MTLALLQAVRAVVDADPPGWKRGAIARRLGISASELSNMLSGRKVIRRETLEQLATLLEIDEPVRQHWRRAHSAAFVEVHPEMREWVEMAAACSDAVARERETEERYQQLESEDRRLQADFLAAEQELDDMRQQLADLEQAARLERDHHRRQSSDHASRLERKSQELATARRETEQLHATQRADLLAAEQELDDMRQKLAELRGELDEARRERDQARQESARHCDELFTLQSELLVLREQDRQRQDENAVIAQAWQAVDDALEQPRADQAEDPDGPVPALATAAQPAAHRVVSAEGTSPATTGGSTGAANAGSTPAVGSPSTEPVKQSRAAGILAITSFILGVVLVGTGLLVFHEAPGLAHNHYAWSLAGVGLVSILVSMMSAVVYYDDVGDFSPGDDSGMYYYGI